MEKNNLWSVNSTQNFSKPHAQIFFKYLDDFLEFL